VPNGLDRSVFHLDMFEFHLYLLLIVSPSVVAGDSNHLYTFVNWH